MVLTPLGCIPRILRVVKYTFLDSFCQTVFFLGGGKVESVQCCMSPHPHRSVLPKQASFFCQELQTACESCQVSLAIDISRAVFARNQTYKQRSPAVFKRLSLLRNCNTKHEFHTSIRFYSTCIPFPFMLQTTNTISHTKSSCMVSGMLAPNYLSRLYPLQSDHLRLKSALGQSGANQKFRTSAFSGATFTTFELSTFIRKILEVPNFERPTL